MTVNADEASALLKDIAGTERRTREFLVYARAGDYLILWGVIWLFGYSASNFTGARTHEMWIVLNAMGLAATLLIIFRANRRLGSTVARTLLVRPLVAFAALAAFGVLWIVLGKLGGREQSAFWPTYTGTLLFVFGLWTGRALSFFAALIVLLTLAGYFWSGAWFDLWIALTCGSALIAGGFWLRH